MAKEKQMTMISVQVPQDLSDLVGEAAEYRLLSKAAYVRTILLEAARKDIARRDKDAKEGE